MKGFPAAPASLAALLPTLLTALLAAGCASSPWQAVENAPGGRLYVPKVYAPLLPGSMYPDRRMPLKAEGRPSLILVCPGKGDCRKKVILGQAAQRGLVVLAVERPSEAPLKNDLLRTRAEADPERIGWLLVEPTGDFLRRWAEAGAPGDAVAILNPRPSGTAAFPSSPSRKIFFATLLDREPREARGATVLKLYSPNKVGALPNEALRDAVEWLAGALASR